MLSGEQVAELLLRIDAVSVSLTEPFRYASGLTSPIYTNCRLLQSAPRESRAIVEMMAAHLTEQGGDFDVVVGANTASLFLASLLAHRLQIPMAYVRPRAKVHGKQKQMEGVVRAGDRALLVSDVLSTEQGIPEGVAVIESQGATVARCLALFSNDLGDHESFLAERGIPSSALTDLPTLLGVATRLGRISPETRLAIQEWAENPAEWDARRRDAVRRRLEDRKRRIAEVLLEVGAVTINRASPFRYASGLLSPIYTDNRLLMSHPAGWGTVIDGFVEVLTHVVGSTGVVLAGTATSGIPHASLLAERLGLPMVYVDFEEREGGQGGRVEGRIGPGDQAVMIEDHVTTGKSVLAAARALRERGAGVEWCVSIFTYGTPESAAAFQREGMRWVTLCDLSEVLAVALEREYIGPEERDAVLNWLRDPRLWTEREEARRGGSEAAST